MNDKTNTMTWHSRTTPQFWTATVSHVTLFHRAGTREAGRLAIVFDYGPYRYRMAFERHPDRGFEGTCDKFRCDSERLVQSTPMRCCLCDTLQSSALILGLSPWVDDSQQEFDWMGRFQDVQRVIDNNQLFDLDEARHIAATEREGSPLAEVWNRIHARVG